MVAGSAVLDSVGMAGLATASEVADFTEVDSMVVAADFTVAVAVTRNPLRQFNPTRGA
jgi:hypothetical protein